MNTAGDNARRFFAEPGADDISSPRQRILIGVIGLLLPFLVWLVAGLRPTEGLPQKLDSISAYYYTGAVSVFAGGLIALASFLGTYGGYKNEYYVRDRAAGIVAGFAAFLVAFFPTDAPTDSVTISWWEDWMGLVHALSAITLFGSFAFFSLFQFRRTKPGTAALPLDKRVRNWIYVFCGGAIVVSMAWAGGALWVIKGPVFWPETSALFFFGISWVVKGRADMTVRAALYYGRHPRQFINEFRQRFR